MEIRSLFKGVGSPQQGFFAQCFADELRAHRHVVYETAGMEIPGRPAMFTGMVVTSSM